MKRSVAIIGFLVAMAPFSAYAEQTVTWDFRKPEAVMPLVNGLTDVQKTAEGIHIRTSQDGLMGWQNPPLPKVDAAYVYMKSAQAAEAAFMWEPKGAAPGTLLQLFFVSPKSDTFEKISIIPSEYPQWTEKTPVVAFGFPAGTDVVIQKIEWKSWGTGEKFVAAMKSMWTFDILSQYSINFLWGPLYTTNPEILATMYDGLPPKGVSAMRIVYILLLITAIVIWVLVGLRETRRAALVLTSVVAGLWLLLDLRMGSELLSYAMTDIRTYVTAPENERTFRLLDDVPRMTQQAANLLNGKNATSLVLLEPEGNAYDAHVRLKLYPLDTIQYADTLPAAANRAWFIVHRPDITVTNDTVTSGNGRVLSTKGTVLQRFGVDSFLFLEQ